MTFRKNHVKTLEILDVTRIIRILILGVERIVKGSLFGTYEELVVCIMLWTDVSWGIKPGRLEDRDKFGVKHGCVHAKWNYLTKPDVKQLDVGII